MTCCLLPSCVTQLHTLLLIVLSTLCNASVKFLHERVELRQAISAPPSRALSNTFALERVGLYGSGLLGEGAGADAEPSTCLTTSSKENSVGGFGLHLQSCDKGINTNGRGASHRSDLALLDAQRFVLMPNGQIRTVGGLCIRRKLCGTRSFMFDVGSCDGPDYVAVFVVKRPTANHMDRLMALGFPGQAFKAMDCMECGPFLLVERCLMLGDRSPSNGAVCRENWQADPGFTKLPSTYIGDAAVHGRKPSAAAIDGIDQRLYLTEAEEERMDFAGLASTEFDGICGSYVTEGVALDSVFYFHRIS